MPLLTLPSPLTRLWIGPRGAELWVKDDGGLASPYGGNKVRKLALVLPRALALGRSRVLTFGAAGSHHALATAVYAKHFQLRAAALLTPQPWSAHAELTLRAALAQGLEVFPVDNAVDALERLASVYSPRDLLVGPGAMGPLGCRGFVAAADELLAQVQSGLLPQPDCIVVAAGSGSTAAGLLAGFARRKVPIRLVAVAAAPTAGLRALILGQAWLALGREGRRLVRFGTLSRGLKIVVNQAGAGYGRPTEEKGLAREIGRDFGLKLDVTYTAQAFYQALQQVGHPAIAAASRAERVVYWHTLSSSEMTPLLNGAPATVEDAWLARLLVRNSTEAGW